MNILQTVSQAYSCWLWTNITEEVRRYEHLYNPSLNTYKDVPHFICLKQQQYCQISCHSAITWPRFHGNVPKAHFSDSPLFRNCEYSNVNHYSPHAHPNESHNHKHINAFISQALTLIQNIIIHTWHLHRDDTKILLWLPTHACFVSAWQDLRNVLRQSAGDFLRMSGSLPHIQNQSRLS